LLAADRRVPPAGRCIRPAVTDVQPQRIWPDASHPHRLQLVDPGRRTPRSE
jgi:hypothetical protein